MENKEMFGLKGARDALVKRLAISLIQGYEITDDEVADKAIEILSGIGQKEEPKQKVKFEDVPVNWHPLKMGKKGHPHHQGKPLVISDGVRKEGFYSYSGACEFLNRTKGYIHKQIELGQKITSFPDGKEWFILEEWR